MSNDGNSPTRLTPARFLCLLFVVALLLRLMAVLWLRDVNAFPKGPSSADDYEFHVLARSVAEGEGFANDKGRLTSFRAPGFPFVLAGLYYLTGMSCPAAYLFLCVLGALSCIATYLLARELLAEDLARLAAWLAAIYLGHIYFATQFLSENLFVPLLVLSIWLVVRYLKGGSLWLLLVAGLVLGFATLTRPFALLLWPLFGLLLLLPTPQGSDSRGTPRSIGYRLLAGVVWTLPFLATIAPWTVRNYEVHGQFVLVATNGGSTFYGGNNDRVVTEPKFFGYWLSTTDLPDRDLIEATPNEVAHDKMEWKLGIDWARANPGKLALASVLKLGRMPVGLPDFDGGSPWYRILRMVGYWPFLVLFVLGGFVCLRRRLRSPPWLALHATILATMFTAVIFWGSPRFRDVNIGVLAVYGALGLDLFRRHRN